MSVYDSTMPEDRTAGRRRRRALLVLLLAISSLTTIGAGAMSLALFTASDASTAGFTAGTIDITTTPSVLFSVGDLMPGDTRKAELDVANSGTAQLRYAMTALATNADGKDLADQMQLTIQAGTCASPGATLYSGSLASAVIGDPTPGADAGDRTLDAASNETLCFSASLPGSTGNAYQASSTTVTFTFDAEQTANN